MCTDTYTRFTPPHTHTHTFVLKKGNSQNVVHQLAAAVFFLLSMYYGFIVVHLLWTSTKLPTGYSKSGFLGRLSLLIKAVAVAAQLLPGMTGLLFHPGTLAILGINSGDKLNEMDKGGLSQWWTVGCLIFFYLTYGLDLLLVGQFLSTNAEPAAAAKPKSS